MFRKLLIYATLVVGLCGQANQVPNWPSATVFASAANNIAFVGSVENNGGSSSTTASVSYAATGGNTLIVGCMNGTGTGGATSVSDGVNTYNSAVDDNNGQGLKYASNITGGTRTITCTFAAAASFPEIMVVEYSGITNSSPLDQHPAAGSVFSATSMKLTLVNTNTNDLSIGFTYLITGSPGTVTPFTAGYSLAFGGSGAEAVYQIQTTSGSKDVGVNWTNAANGIIVATSFKSS